jgi:hypothetical protein
MKETTSFAAAVQDRWLRGRRRNAIQDPALTSLQHINNSNVSDQDRGRSREIDRNKTPPRARTWSPKPSGRLEMRLGITPTHYAVDSLYIGPNPESDIKEAEEEDLTDDISSQASSILMEGRHSLYGNLWEESEGLIMDAPESSAESSQPILSKHTPTFRRLSAQTLQPSNPAGLFRRKPDSHRRAREILDKAYCRDSVPITPCSSTASLNSTSSVASCVEIFLLLIEPKSKIFELIELSYPRRTTTIAKILKMIPKNVSDPVLAEQKYVGLCRPKKNSEPITELKAYASNSATVSGPTANICQGDIFVAIPANTSSRQMIHLAKPIVSNPHIRKLMSSSQTTPKVLVKRRKTTKDSFCSNASTCNSVTPVVDETPITNTHTPSADKHLVNRDIFCSEDADAYFQYCELTMKRAVAQANFDNAVTPLCKVNTIEANSPPALISRHATLDGHETERSSDDNTSYEGNSNVVGFYSNRAVETSKNYRRIVVNQRFVLARKRRAVRHSRWIRQSLLVLFVLSVLYYLSDPTRLKHGRLHASHQPLGFMAILPLVVSFVVLVKIQRFYLIPIQNSMCPVMQAIVAQMGDSGSTTNPFRFN